MNEKVEVEIKSMMSDTENCYCDACHDIGKVIGIRLPVTRCYDGRNLSTAYQEYWLCAPCRTKLVHALDYPENNE